VGGDGIEKDHQQKHPDKEAEWYDATTIEWPCIARYFFRQLVAPIQISLTWFPNQKIKCITHSWTEDNTDEEHFPNHGDPFQIDEPE